jgi:spore germination protein GerM
MAGKKKIAKKKNSASIGIAFWLIFTVVMCVLFMVNRPKIQQTWDKVFTTSDRSEELEAAEETTDSGEDELFNAIAAAGEDSPPDRPAGDYRNDGNNQIVTEQPEPDRTAPSDAAREPAQESAANQSATAAVAVPAAARPVSPQPARQSMRQRALYFIRVDSTGMVFISQVKRQLAASGSPLNESLEALLAGPSAQEKRNDLTSLIPEGTRVLGVRVSNGTAYINFNERFLFNSFGAEGYIAQLRQIVWTATDSINVGGNVQNVQILIDGRTVDYLGDNIPIGKPISRNSF